MYRLKPEAVPFFKKSIKTAVLDWDKWTKNYNVDPDALEEVKPCYLSYGHEHETKVDNGHPINSSTLGGWSKDGAAFHFTVHFPSMKMKEYDLFNNGNVTRQMMDAVQSSLDRFYSKFNEKSENPD